MGFDPAEKVSFIRGVFRAFSSQMPTIAEPDGPLFGNGDIGVSVGGLEGELTFWISKNDFWRASYAHSKGEAESGIRGLALLQIISPHLRQAEFTAMQKIDTAEVQAELTADGCALRVTAYAPYQENLLIFALESLKGDIPLDVRLAPLNDPDAECSRKQQSGLTLVSKEYVRDVEWTSRAALACRVLDWEGCEGVLREGETITSAVSVFTERDAHDFAARAKAAVLELNASSLRQIHESHLSWWNEFWRTSGIDIPSEPEAERFWYASHYLMACCSKGGCFAPGIFGNWITTNHPNWAGDYHLNYNYQAPWWGAFSSNKVWLAEPYDQPLLDYIPQGRQNARVRLGCRGIYAKVGIGPLGFETSRMFFLDGGGESVDAPYWGQKSNAAYASINMLMRFYSTWDEDYARRCALPYLLEVADFWEDYLRFEDGRYVIYNDCIHENEATGRGVFPWIGDHTPDRSDDFNPLLTLGLLRAVFQGLIDMTDYLGVNQERQERWRHILAHLSDFPTYDRGGKTVFRYTERGMDWCDGNSLGIQHIFPCGAVGLSSEDGLLSTARNTVEALSRWDDFNAFPTFYTAAARVGYEPGVILENLNNQLRTHAFPNFFVYYGGGGIECCSAVPSCINEMLFQSHQGILRLFPVWDRAKDASFYRLRGYGAFLVSAALRGGEISEVSLISEKGRACSMLCPWQSGMAVTKDGLAIPTQTRQTRDGTVYAFPTMAGAEYRIEKVDFA